MNLPSSIKGKNVLITGGLGFIGSNLTHKCLELGAKVTIYDCLDPRSGGNMNNLGNIKSDIITILNDIRNFEGISSAILNKDILFNCAAYTSHPGAMKEPLIDIDVNCKGVINVLEAARRFNPEIKIVHVGTSTQIGKMQFDFVDEKHPEFPLDLYSANKSVSEKYVLIYGSAYKMDTTVIRLGNNYGPRSNIKNPDFGFVNYFIGLALQNKEITIFGNGNQFRNFSYVDDSILALIEAAQNEHANGKVFFAVANEQTTVAEIGEQIVKNIGGKLKFVPWPKERKVIEIGDAVISNEKIKKVLNWEPKTGLEEGLLKTKIYFSDKKKYYLD